MYMKSYFLFQNGGKFAFKQTDRKGGRVHIFVETFHSMGFHDRQSGDCTQSHSQHRSRFQRGFAGGSGERKGRKKVSAPNVKQIDSLFTFILQIFICHL